MELKKGSEKMNLIFQFKIYPVLIVQNFKPVLFY